MYIKYRLTNCEVWWQKGTGMGTRVGQPGHSGDPGYLSEVIQTLRPTGQAINHQRAKKVVFPSERSLPSIINKNPTWLLQPIVQKR